DTQHPRCSNWPIAHQVQQPQQRIGARRHASLMRQSSTSFAAGLQRERRQQFSGFVRAPGVASQHTIEALGEDFAWAIWHIAEPPSAVDSQTYGVAAPGQVEWASKVPAVLAQTQLATLRARHRFARRFGNEDQTAIALDNDQDDAPVLTLPALRHDHR